MIDKLLELLLDECKHDLPDEFYELTQDQQFRFLCNIRMPEAATTELLELQDEYLSAKTIDRGIVTVDDFTYTDNIALWQGDITRLNSDGIVNACNAQLLGCFSPLHNCIDNVIHTFAGIQVRIDCNNIMQGRQLPNGEVKVTSAYNLPSNYIFHTVGLIVNNGKPNNQNKKDLRNCYVSSLEKAVEMGLHSITFCSISTGVYGYPKEQACGLAVKTVKEWLQQNSEINVVFNVYLDDDWVYYKNELSR